VKGLKSRQTDDQCACVVFALASTSEVVRSEVGSWKPVGDRVGYDGVCHYSFGGGLSRVKMGCSLAAALLENVFRCPTTGPCQASRAAISLATYTVR